MYRVIAIVGGALALAACSSNSEFLNLDALKPGPVMDTVRFESEPPGAEAKTSNGQTCRTPCALALPADAPLTVTFTLDGYQPESDQLEVINMAGSPPQLRPNPVLAELPPAPPPSPPSPPPALVVASAPPVLPELAVVTPPSPTTHSAVAFSVTTQVCPSTQPQ